MKVVTLNFNTDLEKFAGEYTNFKHLTETLKAERKDFGVVVLQKTKSAIFNDLVFIAEDVEVGEYGEDAEGYITYDLLPEIQEKYHFLGTF